MWIVLRWPDALHGVESPEEYIGPFDTREKAEAWVNTHMADLNYELVELSCPDGWVHYPRK
jgi:hypothetical protein